MKKPELSEQPSEEFILRVNDFIEMANRIERRFGSSAHAQVAFLHGFARYSAHHYLMTVDPGKDSHEERADYCNYIGSQVANLLINNLGEMAGPPDQRPAGTVADASGPAAE